MSEDKKQTKVQPTSDVSEKQTKVEVEKESQKLEAKEASSKEEKAPEELRLNSLFAFKLGMAHVYNKKNKFTPVTALQYKPLKVTQIKTKKRDGYEAVQVAVESKKKNQSKALSRHLELAGVQNASMIKEVRQPLPDKVTLGQSVSINSMQVGDIISVSSVSKGHGFSGVMKRWGFGGGGASHGTEKHRTTGSIANTATQGRVFPGKKLPGHYGCDQITIKNVEVVNVTPSEGMIFVKGNVPGAVHSLVELRK